jgi:hypothetical protein
VKVLSPRVHGYLDYAAVLLLAFIPTLFGFTGAPAALCYVVAILHLGMSLMTAYPLGMAKVIPFTVHGGVEFATAFFLALSPWIFGFSGLDVARNFFVAFGIGLGGLWLTTNYKAAQRPHLVTAEDVETFPSHPSIS